MTPTRHVCVDTLEHLQSLYGEVAEASLRKEINYIHPHYRAMIEASPFMVLATSGPGGLDASPRGDAAGFVVVEDEKTLLLPDRRGNNRIDSLRNLLSDPRVGLLFLIPGRGETLRVNGRARIAITPELLTRFAVDGKPPRSVLVIDVESVYFQCARAIVRAGLWQADAHPAVALPSIGTILSDLSNATIDGSAYDRALPERIRNTLY